MQLKESGIPLTIGIRNPSSTDNLDWNPVAGIQNPPRGIQNPRLSLIPLHGAIVEVNNAFPQKRMIVSLFSYYHYAVIFN